MLLRKSRPGRETGGVGISANGQFRIFHNGKRRTGAALWALVDDLVAKRVDGNDTRLTAVEWKSGTNMRIVAPFGGEAEMRRQIGKPSL